MLNQLFLLLFSVIFTFHENCNGFHMKFCELLGYHQTADSTQISHFDLVFHRIHREGQLGMYLNFWQCLVVHLCDY